jgi:hypothetical protein
MAMRICTWISVMAMVTVIAQSSVGEPQPLEHQVVPLQALSKLATDKRFETVWGDPSIAGAPFVIRIHAEAGYIIMPHTHEVDENIVVLKGSWALGMGVRFKRDALESMEVGDFGFAPRKMVHFAFSRTATIIQVHGIGPFATKWLVPMYELSNKGVLLKTSAGDSGSLAPASPEGCFALTLGARVRSGFGEGVVAGAQCTPGQLTQYRIEKPDGKLFWAQRDELNTL